MFDQQESPFAAQYQSELTLVWANVNSFGDASLSDLATPLKAFLETESALLSYSLCSFLGGTPLLALWIEWVNQYSNLIDHPELLLPTNRKAINNLYGPELLPDNILEKLAQQFGVYQLQWMHSQMWELRDLIISKHPYLTKFIEPDFWSLHLASKSFRVTMFASPDLKLGDVLDNLSADVGFLQISLPCLIGMVYSFSLPDSPVNSKAINWTQVRKILDQISTLYSLVAPNDNRVEQFIYYRKLSPDQQIAWWQLGVITQNTLLNSEPDLKATIQDIILQYEHNIASDIDRILLPDKYKLFLQDILEWIKTLG